VKINSDYRDLLKSLNATGVRYLIVGGYAVMIYSEPRYTKDLDIWIDPSPANAQADFTVPEVFYQIGIDPVRIDVQTSIPGMEFGPAWQRKLEVDFGGEPGYVISRDDLLVSKRASRRARDRKDARRLAQPRQPSSSQ
jgi:hypothetical protein